MRLGVGGCDEGAKETKMAHGFAGGVLGLILGAVAFPIVVGAGMGVVLGGYIVAGIFGPVQWPENATLVATTQFLGVSSYIGAIGGAFAGVLFGINAR